MTELGAYLLGITLKHISAYCLENAKEPVSETFLEKLLEWEQKSGRIRIQKITVIETDDPALLDEVMKFPGIKGVSEKKEVTKQIILTLGQEKKAKKAIEKKEFFCELETQSF